MAAMRAKYRLYKYNQPHQSSRLHQADCAVLWRAAACRAARIIALDR